MSFNHYARKVRNSRLPISRRRSALSSCVGQISWLTRKRYSQLCSHFQIDFQSRLTDVQLVEKVTEIELMRNHFLNKLETFKRQRLSEKHQGQRQPRRKDVQALYEINEING
jgi:hypothetical protein